MQRGVRLVTDRITDDALQHAFLALGADEAMPGEADRWVLGPTKVVHPAFHYGEPLK